MIPFISSWEKILTRVVYQIISVLFVWGSVIVYGQDTSQASNNLHPDISPNGNRIIFESDRDGNSEIYLMNIDGSNLRQLTNNAAIDTAPVWSRDGKKILFRSTRESERHPWPYYVMNPDGTKQVRVDDVDDHANVFRDWSPDGSKVLLFKDSGSKNTDIYCMNADGTGEQRLTFKKAYDCDMSFSPDGTKIVYESILGKDVSTAVIMIMEVDGSNKIQLASGTDPKWSPDGFRILYKARDDAGECCEIYVMQADGSDQTRLAANGYFHRWLPDGSKIIYFASASGTHQIYIMDPDGSNKAQLTH